MGLGGLCEFVVRGFQICVGFPQRSSDVHSETSIWVVRIR